MSTLSLSDKIRVARTVYEKDFAKGLGEADTVWQKLAKESTLSQGSVKEFPMLFAQVDFEEWAGERNSGVMNSEVYSFGVKEYQAYYRVPTTTFEDEIYLDDGTRDGFVDMGRAASALPDKLVAAAFENGDASTSICVDKMPFFSAAHPTNYFEDGSPVFSNLYTGLDMTLDNILTVIEDMKLRKTWMGLPFKVKPNILMVHPKRGTEARDLMEEQHTIVTASTGEALYVKNKGYNKLMVIENDYLTNENDWYVLGAVGSRKPAHLLWRKKPVMKQETPTPHDENHVREMSYLVNARAGVGYDFPHLASKCKP
jgi:phage major head subunit gpT-like protein